MIDRSVDIRSVKHSSAGRVLGASANVVNAKMIVLVNDVILV